MNSEETNEPMLRPNAEGGDTRPFLPFDMGAPNEQLLIYEDFEISDSTRTQYMRVPPAVLKEMEYLYIAGFASTYEHMRQLLAHKVRTVVPKEIVKYHFSVNREKLEAARRQFLEKLHQGALMEAEMLANSPSLAKAARMNNGLSMATESVISRMLAGKMQLDLAELKILSGLVKDVLETDPILKYYGGKIARKATGGPQNFTADTKRKVDKLVEYADGRASDAKEKELLETFENDTNELLEQEGY